MFYKLKIYYILKKPKKCIVSFMHQSITSPALNSYSRQYTNNLNGF